MFEEANGSKLAVPKNIVETKKTVFSKKSKKFYTVDIKDVTERVLEHLYNKHLWGFFDSRFFHKLYL
jgi:hypothetical protein